MNIVLSRKIRIKGAPANGNEAYKAVIAQLRSEISERQEILNELSAPAVKKEIIKQWTPTKRNITITMYEA